MDKTIAHLASGKGRQITLCPDPIKILFIKFLKLKLK